MKNSLNLYRILTYVFDLALIVGLTLSIYEYFIEKRDYGWEAIPINLLIIYALISSFYFIHKTKTIYKLELNNKSENIETEFKFGKLIGITNILIGTSFVLFPIIFLFINPISQFNLVETSRIFLNIFLIVYGILKILYSRKILIII